MRLGSSFFTVLAPSERYHQTQGHRHKVLTDWARPMLTQVRRWVPQRAIVLVADSSFAALELLESLRQLPHPIHVVTRLRLDAALYDPAPERLPKQRGRPRKVGNRLPTLKSILEDAQTDWQSLIIEGGYGRRAYPVEVISRTAVWYHTGMAAVPIRWVLVRDPQGHFAPQAFRCTDLSAAPSQIVPWFCQRWRGEVTFEEVRAHWGSKLNGNGLI